MGISTAAGAALGALILLGACTGDGASGDDEATPTTTTAPASSTTTEACPVDGRARTIEGLRVREFCGPARAIVRVGPDEVHDFTGGRCVAHDDWFELHLGTEVVEPEAAGAPRFRSFTMLLGRHPLATDGAPPADTDGTFHDGVVTFTLPGFVHILEDKTVTLENGRSEGSIAGAAFRFGSTDPVPIRGRFACTLEASTALEAEAIEVPPTVPTTTSTSAASTTSSTGPPA